MDIKQLTQEMHRFVRTKGWYETGSTRPQTLRNLAISLCLESTEVLEHFQWIDEPNDPQDLSGEIADVALYLMQIASLAGIDLEQAVLAKLEQNYRRTWDDQDSNTGLQIDVSQESSVPNNYHKNSVSFNVTVLGGASPKPGDAVYEDAFQFGKLLGSQGWTVLNGGYVGVMEAVSRGAAEAGGYVIGITCGEIENWRAVSHNPWIHEEIRLPTLRQRLLALIDHGDAIVALPGGVGTLTEILMTWNQLLISAISPRPLIMIGSQWHQVIEQFFLEQNNLIPHEHRDWITFAENVQDAFVLLQDHYRLTCAH